jgi:hypothetical protein
MVKDNLETKAKKSVVKIEKNVAGIYNILTDLSLKLYHIITSMRDYRTHGEDPYF